MSLRAGGRVGSPPALRVTYVGELGSSTALRVRQPWTRLKVPEPGLVAGGYKAAIHAPRKGIPRLGLDISPDANPYQAGWGSRQARGDFVGSDAC